jgi:hypothetical protein
LVGVSVNHPSLRRLDPAAKSPLAYVERVTRPGGHDGVVVDPPVPRERDQDSPPVTGDVAAFGCVYLGGLTRLNTATTTMGGVPP